MAVFNELVGGGAERGEGMVGAYAAQAGLVHGLSEFRGGAVVIAGGFDLDVADLVELVERSVKVLGSSSRTL